MSVEAGGAASEQHDAATLRAAARAALQAPVSPGARVQTAAGSAALIELEGRRCLLVQTTTVVCESLAEAARRSEIFLRELSAETLLLPAGLGLGFRVEDLLLVELSAPRGQLPALRAWFGRRLLPEAELSEREGVEVGLRAVFAERGEMATSQRKIYQPESML